VRSRPTRRAQRDIEDEIARLALEAGEEMAIRFHDGVKTSVAHIERFPRIGSPRLWRHSRLRGIRCWPIIGFSGHILYYRVERTEIRVLRILRPGVLAESTLLTPYD
jgi:plasmid stabilization system protein ParE